MELLSSIGTETDGFVMFALFFPIFKDGPYYCYCAQVLRISRHSGFL